MNVSDNGGYHKSVRLFLEKDHDKPMMTLWKSVEPMANQGVLERKSCVAGVPNCDKHALVAAFNPSEKYEFVSWDDDYSQYMGKKNVPNHQPVQNENALSWTNSKLCFSPGPFSCSIPS